MNISSNISQLNNTQTVIKSLYSEKIPKDELKAVKEQISQNINAFTFKSFSTQTNIISLEDKFAKDYNGFQSFLKSINYKGKNIANLSQDEASKLISADGIFGIKQTSSRIANFVINGANGNEALLRAGKDGMLQGFKAAENMWGGKLPDISQQTMQEAIKLVDQEMSKLGISILDTQV